MQAHGVLECFQAVKRGAKTSNAAATTTLSQAAVGTALDLTQEDEAAARREAEVAVTTELINNFQQHLALWEAIEARSTCVWMQLAGLLHTPLISLAQEPQAFFK